MVTAGSVYPSQQTVLDWFNASAFAVQPTGTSGDLGRFAIYGLGSIQFDISFSLATCTFGQITSFGGPGNSMALQFRF